MKIYRCYMGNDEWGEGRDVHIAHIDSGINAWHPHIGEVAGGISFQVDETGTIRVEENFGDKLGHGTAVAGVIKEQVPYANLWAVKIFHETLSTHVEVLCAAIEWCIDAKMDFINLSLGVKKDIPMFQKVCKQAERNGIIIISSCDERNNLLWPGYYDEVFGVKAGEYCNSDTFIYRPEEKVNFLAAGLPRQLEGPMQKFNFQGHSFAAAHVTAFLAKIKEKYSLNSKKELESVLKEIFCTEKKTASR